MPTKLYQMQGFAVGGQSATQVYDNDSGIWTPGTAFTGPTTIVSAATFRQAGGWDGNYWYVIGADGKLYRFNPITPAWSAALGGGAVIVPTTIEDQNWAMCSDGRFVYIYTPSGFRRYDPSGDTFLALLDQGQNAFGNQIFTVYDGVDTIYISRGENFQTGFSKYVISTATWSNLTAIPVSDSQAHFAGFLQGKLYLLNMQNQVATNAYEYTPGANTWATKAAVTAQNGITAVSAYGEISDAVIRVWCNGTPGAGTFTAFDYNCLTNTWASGPTSTFNTAQGGNWAVSRLFTPGFSYYESDGVTPLNPTKNLLSVAVGGTLQYQVKVKTAGAKAGGATVTVPTLTGTDAEDVVTICGTQGGTYGTSFVTAALTAGQFFDVFIKVVPTVNQTLGLSKLWNLRCV